MQNITIKSLLISSGVIILASCTTFEEQTEMKYNYNPNIAQKWELFNGPDTINSENFTITPNPENQTLSFKMGCVEGSVPMKLYYDKIEIEKSDLRNNSKPTTDCIDSQATIDYKPKYIKKLSYVENYKIEKNKLLIKDGKKTLLEFIKSK